MAFSQLIPDRYPAAVAGTTMIGAFLRIFRIGDESLWVDEALSLEFIRELSTFELLVRIPFMDNSPPLYYILLDIWTGFTGVSEVGLRSLSAVLSIFSIPMVYLVARELFNRKVGLLAAGIFAISPFQVWFAQEARMYSLLATLTIVSFYCLLRVLDSPGSRWYRLGYVLFAVGLGYTHVYGIFVIFAQSSFVGFSFWKSDSSISAPLKPIIRIQVLVWILVMPYLIVLLTKIVLGHADVWVPFPTLRRIFGTPLAHVGTFQGIRNTLFTNLLIGALLLVIGLSGLRASEIFEQHPVKKRKKRSVLLVSLWTVIPIGIPLLLSGIVTPIYVIRYTIPASIGLYLLMSYGTLALPTPRIRWVVVLLLALVLVQPLLPLYQADQKDQWREVAEIIDTDASPGDQIVLSPPYAEPALRYYLPTDKDVITLEAAERGRINDMLPSDESIWLVTTDLKPSESERLLSALKKSHSRVNTWELQRVHVSRLVPPDMGNPERYMDS